MTRLEAETRVRGIGCWDDIKGRDKGLGRDWGLGDYGIAIKVFIQHRYFYQECATQ